MDPDAPDKCYLCHQVPHSDGFGAELAEEQERVASQIVETDELVAVRTAEVEVLRAEVAQIAANQSAHTVALDQATLEFVSANDALTTLAAERARLEAETESLQEYRELFVRFSDLEGTSTRLEEERADLADALGREGLRTDRSIALLDHARRTVSEYVQRLNISLTELPVTARINRTNYLPEVDGRPFDELSSQGLSVLVNVAHTLAHHTVSLDHDLPLPTLLVLDGLSNNVGHEGFKTLDRRDDTYRLLIDEVQRYAGRLQVVPIRQRCPHVFARQRRLSRSSNRRTGLCVRKHTKRNRRPTPASP